MKNEREPPLPLPLTLGRLPRILHFLAFWVNVEWYDMLLVIWHLLFNISMKLQGFVCLFVWMTNWRLFKCVVGKFIWIPDY